MEQYAGLDVSSEERTSLCVVDANGRIVREDRIASGPEAEIAWFRAHRVPMARIGHEAGPLSQWLFAAMGDAGLPARLIETRHVRAACRAMPVKVDRDAPGGLVAMHQGGATRERPDRRGARGIAQLMVDGNAIDRLVPVGGLQIACRAGGAGACRPTSYRWR